MDDLEQRILDALADGEQKTKPDLVKIVGDVDGAHLATALRALKRRGRVIVGSDGSKRVYRLPTAVHA